MPDIDGVAVSPALASALHDFRPLLEPDDLDRTQALGRAASETLAAMVEAIEPLYPEINSLLDRLVTQPHPLPEDLEHLEADLNSLAQAALEARQDLASRHEGRPSDT